MKNLKIKKATIARICALVVALINQALVLFGHGVLPITENMAYQIASYAITVFVVLINAWYNNDITKFAILAGGVFDALKDGKITEIEVKKIIAEISDTKEAE